MSAARAWRNFDPLLLLITAALIGFGAAMLYSSSFNTEAANFWSMDSPASRHLLYASVGLGVMLVVATIDYHLYGQWAPGIYVITLGILMLVIAMGQTEYGATRWLDSPLMPVQPSELAKMMTIVVLARFFSWREAKIKSVWTTAGSLAIAAVPAGLVFLQPNLGTAVIFGGAWLGMALIAGTPWWHFAVLFGSGLLALPIALQYALRGYMHDRLALFLDPGADPLGAGYNVLQSEISVGSGGFWGKGFLNGTQTQLHYLRIQKTDFIFSVVGEELGFIGAVLLFGLFVLLLFRALRAATLAPDTMGRLIVAGVVSVILLQVFINIGVNVRLLPVTGIPLPFISSGGSSLISTLLALGLVQSVVMRKKRLHRFETT